jgi:hypothetical protein
MATAHHCGTDPGLAEIHDPALLGTGYAALTGFLHAAALLHATGTPPTRLAPLAARWLDQMGAFLPDLAREAETGTYANAPSTVDLNHAPVNAIITLHPTHDVPTDLHRCLARLLDQRSAEGHGTESFSSVFELLRPHPAGSRGASSG